MLERPIALSATLALLAACGGGGGSGTTSAAPLPKVTGVSAVAHAGHVTLTWTNDPAYYAYSVYHRTSPGVTPQNGILHRGVVSGTWIDPVVDGSTYYVVVTGLSSSGEGPPSDEVHVVALGAHVGTVATVAGSSMGLQNGDANTARFTAPKGIATDGTNVFVADTANNQLRWIDLAHGQVYTLAGNVNGYTGSGDGTYTGAGFSNPSGLVVSGGFLYVADRGNSTIRKVDPYAGGGAVVTTVAGTAGTTGHADLTGTSATFKYPRGVTSDGTYLYVTDTGNNTIRRILLATGEVTTLAGSATAYAGLADGSGTAARFSGPTGIAYRGGKLYVADTENSAIRVVDATTGVTSTLAARASRPAGLAISGTYLYYTNIATAPGGAVLPGDGNTLTEVNLLTGDAVSIAGGNVDVVSADGTGASASFNHPEGLDASGSTLWIADTLSDLVRQVSVHMP